MKLKNNKGNKNVIIFISIEILIMLYSCLSGVIHSLSIKDILLYVLFQFFYLLIPGMAVCIISKVYLKNIYSLISWSYVFGLTLLVLIYFLTIRISSVGAQKFIFLVYIIVSVGIVVKNKNRIILNEDIVEFWLIAFVIITLAIGFGTTSLRNTLPIENGANSFHPDFLFWISNSISLKKGFPAELLRLPGVRLYYHYLSNVVIAQSSIITGIDIVEISAYFSFVIPCLMLVLAGYEFFQSILYEKRKVYMALVFLIFTEGTAVTYTWHIFYNPFGFDYAYFFAIISMSIGMRLLKEKGSSFRDTVVISILIAMTTGFKGSTGAILLFSCGIIVFYRLFAKKKKIAIVEGGAFIAAFSVVFVTIIGGLGSGGDNKIDYVGFFNTKGTNPWLSNGLLAGFYKKMLLMTGNDFLSRILSLFELIFKTNVVSMILLLIGVVVLIFGLVKRKPDSDLLMLCLTSICGIYLTCCTSQSGGSQMYFIMVIIPYAISAGFIALERVKEIKALHSLLLGVMCVCAFFSVKSFLIGDGLSYEFGDITGMISKCWKIYNCGGDVERFYVTDKDYEAYRWLYENTEDDTIIAVDSFVGADGVQQDMVASTFSERKIYNDGYYIVGFKNEINHRKDIVNDYLNGDSGAYNVLKNEKDVNYILITKMVNPTLELPIEKVFENERFRIYRI